MTWPTARNRSKYGAKKIVADGIRFDSLAEEKRYQGLKLMQLAGEIRGLKVHPIYPMRVIERHVCDYEPDFEYEAFRFGVWVAVVEDVKGMRSGPAWSVFRIKSKLFRAIYGFEVEVFPPPPPKQPRRKAMSGPKILGGER